MSERRTRRKSRAPRRGKPGTDWERVDALGDDEIAEAVASDADAAPIADDDWFSEATVVLPRKERITAAFDADVIDFFRGFGRGYQARMNAVLRSYKDHYERTAVGTRKARRGE